MVPALSILKRLLLLSLGGGGLFLAQTFPLPLLETVGLIVFSIVCFVVAVLPGRVRWSWVLEAFDLV